MKRTTERWRNWRYVCYRRRKDAERYSRKYSETSGEYQGSVIKNPAVKRGRLEWWSIFIHLSFSFVQIGYFPFFLFLVDGHLIKASEATNQRSRKKTERNPYSDNFLPMLNNYLHNTFLLLKVCRCEILEIDYLVINKDSFGILSKIPYNQYSYKN